MKAIGKKIVVETKIVEKEMNGIFLPENSQAGKDVELYIAELGPEVKNKDLKKGVRVVIDQRKAVPLKVEDKEYVVIEEDSILVVL